jgi:hypothetical protein
MLLEIFCNSIFSREGKMADSRTPYQPPDPEEKRAAEKAAAKKAAEAKAAKEEEKAAAAATELPGIIRLLTLIPNYGVLRG